MNVHQTAHLPANFRRIRLELAREPGHPEGESDIGYTMLAPLSADGRLDAETARHYRHDCKVIRFRPDEETQQGYLRRRPGGFWAFHYDLPNGEEDEDTGYRLAEHRFAPGDYVTIMEDEGAHTYRVASVRGL